MWATFEQYVRSWGEGLVERKHASESSSLKDADKSAVNGRAGKTNNGNKYMIVMQYSSSSTKKITITTQSQSLCR